MSLNDESRLNRIEAKLDKVAEALFSLARMEERMVSLFKRMDTYDDQQRDITKRVAELEKSESSQTTKVDWFERIMFIIAAAVIALVINLLVGKI